MRKRHSEIGTPKSAALPSIVRDALRSPGQSLDVNSREFFEPLFGQDFSHVSVHTDAKARESARAVNALAYTVGSHVVMGGDQQESGTAAGQPLLAHELAHVVQQSAGTDGSNHESRADSVADRVMSGQVVNPASVGSAPVGLQRKAAGPDDDWFRNLLSPKSQLHAISLTDAVHLSQTKKGIIPPIPADSPLLGPAAQNRSMLSPQAEHPIDIHLPPGKRDKDPGVGFNLGRGLRLYGDKKEESKNPGASPVKQDQEGQPFLQQRLKDALESVNMILSWTIGAHKDKR
jgi:hypothetical protein